MIGLVIVLLAVLLVLWIRVGRLEDRVMALENKPRVVWHVGEPMEE